MKQAIIGGTAIIGLAHLYKIIQSQPEGKVKEEISGIEKSEKCEKNVCFGYGDEILLEALEEVDQLNSHQVERYSRQLLLSNVSVEGQISILNTSVLLVGAGGLASSAAMYLAGSGVGRIGIVDYDTVEESNLHRQIIHSEESIGISKAKSAQMAVKRFNSSIECIAYDVAFDSKNALDIIKDYDIVVDCSDNVATRYLINDACVLSEKPLVSGSAIRMEGQLTVYNYNEGPCYRCIFPTPPPPQTVGNCSDNGVLGVIPGILGSLQSLEVTKIITGNGNVLSQKLLMFDGYSSTFRVVKLRPRKPDCSVCGDNPTITELIDYEEFCGVPAHDRDNGVKDILEQQQHISCADYNKIRNTEKHILLDVRDDLQYKMCKLENSVHMPLEKLRKASWEEIQEVINNADNETPIYTLCRRGRRSQEAVKILETHGIKSRNISGGLSSWHHEIDNTFPLY
eukprot:TRINITY_DN10504_c0_g1_i1.p1 TRINITY_DN10504_c0_g1~~TRINITY_DN10504_c0_g1_i1.p1  ORF type:complete len:466 (-),score=103.20 TRINITY_DN10504_c0_g1_i1:36-1400(-)